MSIRAGFGITSAPDQAPALPGTLGGGALTRGYLNQAFAQVSTWTVTGVDTSGIHSVTIGLPDGTTLTAIYEATVPADDDTIVAAGLAAYINTTDTWRNVASAGNVAGVVTVTYLHTGIVYPAEGTVVQGGANIAVANTTTAGGSSFPAARFFMAVANAQGDKGRALTLPDGASADQISGVSSRPHGKNENSRSTDPAVTETWPNGQMVDGCYSGPVQMVNKGAAVIAGAVVHAVTSTAGGDALGDARGDAQNSVAMPRARAYWRDDTGAGAVGWVFLDT